MGSVEMPVTVVEFGLKAQVWWRDLAKPWLAKWWSGLVAFAATLLIASHYVTLAINVTPSLPHHVYLVMKQEKSVGPGQFVAFNLLVETGPYPAGLTFVKQVAGVPGDAVRIGEKRDFTVVPARGAAGLIPGANGEVQAAREAVQVGVAKEVGSVGRMAGKELKLGFEGVIPEGKLFVRGWHTDSLDSRYAVMGLIDQSQVVGRAIVLF